MTNNIPGERESLRKREALSPKHWTIVGLAIATGVLALALVPGQGWMVDRDFFTYWAGGRGLLNGVNLYDTVAWLDLHHRYGSGWFPNPVFIYAPQTAIAFAPLAALPIQVASTLWVWFSAVAVLISVLLLAKEFSWSHLFRYAPLWILGVSLFLPVMLTLLMGQVSALLLLLVVTSGILWNRGRWLGGGLLLGLTVVKPQPVVLLIPTLALWLVLKRQWRGLFGLAASLGLGGIGALILYPNFLWDYQKAVFYKIGGVADRMPTLWGIGSDLGGRAALPVVGAALSMIAIIISLTVIIRWQDRDPLTLIALLIPFSLLVTPYLWNYDQVLLLAPLLLALIRLDQRRVKSWIVALTPLVFDFIALLLLLVASVRVRDTFSAGLTLLVAILLWAVLRRGPIQSSAQ